MRSDSRRSPVILLVLATVLAALAWVMIAAGIPLFAGLALLLVALTVLSVGGWQMGRLR